MADLAKLRAGGWEQIALPERVERYPTMLTLEERRLLHWLARDVWEGWGAIVDAGSFVGGSTASFATGLRARGDAVTEDGPRPPMWTYDLFAAGEFEVRSGHLSPWPEIGVGDSFRPAFDDLLGDLADETRVHEGDIMAEEWDGGPIEILFLDVLKMREINDVVLMRLLPSLVAGRSVIVQQDYVHGMLPWIHVTMELLGDVVEHVEDVPWSGSRVYAVTDEITGERVAEILPLDERVPAAQQRRSMERAVGATWGPARGMLLLAQANLLRCQGDVAAARALLEHVEAHFADVPNVMYDVTETRRVLDAVGAA